MAKTISVIKASIYENRYIDNSFETVREGVFMNVFYVNTSNYESSLQLQIINQRHESVGNAGFTLYKDTDEKGIHKPNFGKILEPEKRTHPYYGSIIFDQKLQSERYLLVQTYVPYGHEEIAEDSYILIQVLEHGEIEVTSVGEFAEPERVLPSITMKGDLHITISNKKRSCLLIEHEVKTEESCQKVFEFMIHLYDEHKNRIKNHIVECLGTSYQPNVERPTETIVKFNEDGLATIRLKHGQSLMLISAIPYLGSYSVIESAANQIDYCTESVGSLGICVSEAATARFVHKRKAKSERYHDNE